MFKKILFTIVFSLLFANGFHAQSINKISTRCQSPNNSVFASIVASTAGDIIHTPCPSRSSIFTGLVDFSGATVTGVVTGSGTINFVPRFTAASVIGNTPFSWDGTVYTFQNTAGTGAGFMDYTPAALANNGALRINPTSTTGGILLNSGGMDFMVGDLSGNNWSLAHFGTTVLFIADVGGSFNAGGSSATTNIRTGVGAATQITLTAASDTLSTTASVWNFQNVLTFNLERTNTAGGTTGNQTINKPNGSVNIAAAGTGVVVTNNTVFSTSNILALTQTNDATCSVKNAVPTASTITITMTAACTAETRVAFWVYN